MKVRDTFTATEDEPTEREETLGAGERTSPTKPSRWRVLDGFMRRLTSKRSCLALGLFGTISILLGIVFTAGRSVLLVVGSTSVFVAILVPVISPKRVISPVVARSVYDALAETRTSFTVESGHPYEQIYVPGVHDDRIRLFIPQHTDEKDSSYTAGQFTGTLEDEGRHGQLLQPSADGLFNEFDRALAGEVSNTPETLVAQIDEGLVQLFELVERTDVHFDPAENNLMFGIAGSVLGPIDRIDHPVVSFIGVCMARGMECPVTVKPESIDEKHCDYLVTCTWSRKN